jgi:hypothetical protein
MPKYVTPFAKSELFSQFADALFLSNSSCAKGPGAAPAARHQVNPRRPENLLTVASLFQPSRLNPDERGHHVISGDATKPSSSITNSIAT